MIPIQLVSVGIARPLIELLQVAIRSGQVRPIYVLQDPDGRRVIFLRKGFPSRGGSGSVQLIVAVGGLLGRILVIAQRGEGVACGFQLARVLLRQRQLITTGVDPLQRPFVIAHLFIQVDGFLIFLLVFQPRALVEDHLVQGVHGLRVVQLADVLQRSLHVAAFLIALGDLFFGVLRPLDAVLIISQLGKVFQRRIIIPRRKLRLGQLVAALIFQCLTVLIAAQQIKRFQRGGIIAPADGGLGQLVAHVLKQAFAVLIAIQPGQQLLGTLIVAVFHRRFSLLIPTLLQKLRRVGILSGAFQKRNGRVIGLLLHQLHGPVIIADLRLSQAVQIVGDLSECFGRVLVVLLLHPRPAILIQAVVALGQRILIIRNFQIAFPGGLQIAVGQRLFRQPVDRRLTLFLRILPAGGQQVQSDGFFVVALVRLLGGQPVIAFPDLVVRVLIAAQIHIQGQCHVFVSCVQQFFRLLIGALLAAFRAVLIVAQTLESVHSLVVQLVRQIAFAQQIYGFLPLILAVGVAVQPGQQLFRFRQVVRAACIPQVEGLLIIALLLTLQCVPIIAHGGKSRLGLVVLLGGQLLHRGVIAQGGQHPQHAEQHGGQRQHARDTPADDAVFPAALLTALFVFFFQQTAVFLAGLSRHVRQFLLMDGDHLPHVFPAEAGEDRIPAPFAAAAPG